MPKRTRAKKTRARKTAAKKTRASKTGAKRAGAKSAGARKTAAKRTAARKRAATKPPAKKTAARKPAAKVAAATKTTDKLLIKRGYDAPIDVVWDAWADPVQAKQWWGPRGFTAPVVELDEWPGGSWRAQMVGPDGTELWQHGVYREIVPRKRLVYTFIWDQEPDHEMLVSVDFAARGNGTEITFQQMGFKSAGEREGHQGGWGESFDRLSGFLKDSASNTSRFSGGDAHAR
jgi:uncharacterized protein YndB with AHSA1/START domain